MTAPARTADQPATDPEWRLRAACRGLPAHQADAAFFPLRGHVAHRTAADTAQRYCGPCPVRAACAAAHPDEPGVFAGEYRVPQPGRLLAVTDYLATPPTTTVREVAR